MGGCWTVPQIKWAKYVDDQTIHDAWETYRNHFANRFGIMTELTFRAHLRQGYYTTWPVAEFVHPKPPVEIENMSPERLQARSAEEAYPLRQRQRGQKDLDSVEYLRETDDFVSPIIMIKRSPATYILLDGMHRLVASALRSGLNHARVRVLMVPLDPPPTW